MALKRNHEQTPLPEGVSLEQLDQYARARVNAQRRASYARHPARVMAQRLRSAVNLLERTGHMDRMSATAIRCQIILEYKALTQGGEGK